MTLRPLSMCAIALLIGAFAQAQGDSSRLQAGNVSFSSSFTQHTTIRGAQLETMPFSSLDEAVNVYFNGAYTTEGTIVYVIDGNVGADVNAYSIHDIESITLIHDARVIANEAKSGAVLVLVATKTGAKKKSGFTIAASEYVVHDSTLTPFHRLYASASKHFSKLAIGASASYLHEVFPLQASYKPTSGTENRFNRFSFNGWIAAEVGRSDLTVRLNASPADSTLRYMLADNNQVAYDFHEKTNHLQLRPSASLNTYISNHFKNELSVSYLSYSNRSAGDYMATGANFQQVAKASARLSDDIFMVRERIGYVKQSGAWTINPSVNFTGLHATVKSKESAFYSSSTGSMGASFSDNKLKQRQLIFSPAVDINHSNIFGLQVGLQYRTRHSNNVRTQKEKVYPFGAFSVDVVKIFDKSSNGSVLIHASHASAKSDLSTFQNPIPIVAYDISTGMYDTIIISNDYTLSYKPHRATDGGITAKINRSVRVLYTYENNSFSINIPQTVYQPGGNYYGYLVEAIVKLNSHRVGVEFETPEEKPVRYKGTVSMYKMQSSFDYSNKQVYWEVLYKDYYPRNGLTGGVTNEFTFNNFSTGLNALYYFNEHDWRREDDGNGPKSTLHKHNSFVLQHIYVAWQIKNMSLFVNARNLLGSDDRSFYNANRKYFGAGFKVEL